MVRRIKKFGKKKAQISEIPTWFNKNGGTVRFIGLDDANSENPKVILESKDVRVELYQDLSKTYYFVEYRTFSRNEFLNHSSVSMQQKEFEVAFGLSDEIPSAWQKLAQKHDADAVIKGVCIRKANFLNVPGPSTGGDESYVSLIVDQKMRETIRTFLLR